MQRYRESIGYTTRAGTADVTQAAPPAAASVYASVDAALAAIAGSAFVEFGEPGGARPQRCDLWLVGVGADGSTVRENIYLVQGANIDGQRCVKLELLGLHEATLGVSPVTNGRSNHVFAKLAAWTGSGLAAARTGREPVVFPAGVGGAGNDAGVTVFDVGNFMGILRVPAKGAGGSPATSVSMMHARWD